ncbi:MAG: diguanylate cyclase [Candidatus Omnitrophica bacterium]|nr:diguanylate cyclase [Candidatus Omnitrophota bacterium]
MKDEFNILLVEDEESTFRTLKEAFADSRYKISRATTAKDALKLCHDINFMVIISELRLPDMDGIELIKRIKKANARVNVLVLTVYSFAEHAVKALEAGAFAYFLKPINVQEVKIVLKRAIENTCLLIQAGKKKYYQDMSVMDGLTGVYNHRHFHEVLDWQMSHMRRFPQTFSLFIIDIDNFKKYNDTKGHVEGDKVLHDAAQLFVTITRDSDWVFRYGGEEFAVILPQTPQQQAQIAGERLLRATRAQLPVTISVGLASFPDNAQTKNELVVRADKALYRAKNTGKDKICIYDKNTDK